MIGGSSIEQVLGVISSVSATQAVYGCATLGRLAEDDPDRIAAPPYCARPIFRMRAVSGNAEEELGRKLGLSLHAELCTAAGDIQDETPQSVLAGVANASLQGTRLAR